MMSVLHLVTLASNSHSIRTGYSLNMVGSVIALKVTFLLKTVAASLALRIPVVNHRE
jgi:hypothetical protein